MFLIGGPGRDRTHDLPRQAGRALQVAPRACKSPAIERCDFQLFICRLRFRASDNAQLQPATREKCRSHRLKRRMTKQVHLFFCRSLLLLLLFSGCGAVISRNKF